MVEKKRLTVRRELRDFTISYKELLERRSVNTPHRVDQLSEEDQYPTDITKVGSRRLGHLLSLYTAHLGYTLYVLADAESRLAYCKHKLEERRSYWLYRRAPDNPRDRLKGDLEGEVNQIPEVKQWAEQKVLVEAEALMLRGIKEGFVAYRDGVSREITRRSEDARATGRIA